MNASNKPSIPPVSADAVEDEDLAEQARPPRRTFPGPRCSCPVPAVAAGSRARVTLGVHRRRRTGRSRRRRCRRCGHCRPGGVVVGGTVAAWPVRWAVRLQVPWRRQRVQSQGKPVPPSGSSGDTGGRCRPCVARVRRRRMHPVYRPVRPLSYPPRYNVLIGIVAAIHVYILVLEMLWTGRPAGRPWADAGICAADQDAGRQPGLQRLSRRRLILGWRRAPTAWRSSTFSCALVAGLYGAATASAGSLGAAVPAAVSLLALYLGL